MIQVFFGHELVFHATFQVVFTEIAELVMGIVLFVQTIQLLLHRRLAIARGKIPLCGGRTTDCFPELMLIDDMLDAS